jgi:hypothetical protein
MPKSSAYSLFECNTDANLGILEQILAVYSYDCAALDAGALAFFLCQGFRTREVEFHVMPCAYRCGHRECHKYARLADIAASTYDKSVGLGIHTLTGQETLLRVSLRCSIKACIIHISLIIVTPIISLIGDVKVGRLGKSGKIQTFQQNFFQSLQCVLQAIFL